MRPGQNRRVRGRSRGKGPNPLTRSYESNGPDVKVRGTAQHIADKYAQLARDAQASSDPVAAENYLQHAEHYYRLIAAAQEQFRQQYGQNYQRPFDEDGEEMDEEGGAGFGYPGDRPMQGGPADEFGDAPYGNQPYEPRFNGDRQERGQDRNQDRGERQNGNRYDRNGGDRNGQQQRFDRSGGYDRNGPDRNGYERQDRNGERANGERFDRNGDRRERFGRQDNRQEGNRQEGGRQDGNRQDGNRPEGNREGRRDFNRGERAPREGRGEQPRGYGADVPAEMEVAAPELPAFLTAPVARPAPAPEPVIEAEPVAAAPAVADESEAVVPAPRPRRRRVRRTEETLELAGAEAPKAEEG